MLDCFVTKKLVDIHKAWPAKSCYNKFFKSFKAKDCQI